MFNLSRFKRTDSRGQKKSNLLFKFYKVAGYSYSKKSCIIFGVLGIIKFWCLVLGSMILLAVLFILVVQSFPFTVLLLHLSGVEMWVELHHLH